MIGTGGVGRALAFGLVALGVSEIRLVDKDQAKAEALAAALRQVADAPPVEVFKEAEEAAMGADGILNGTPVGMVGYEGKPLPKAALKGAEWVFDAVYTPVETSFLKDAAACGLAVISGYELFFYQGVHAWARFAGRPLNEGQLRADLLKQGEAA